MQHTGKKRDEEDVLGNTYTSLLVCSISITYHQWEEEKCTTKQEINDIEYIILHSCLGM